MDEVVGITADAVEKLFADVEGQMAPVLRSIIEQEQLPARGTREFDVFLNLVAGMVARVPSTRSVLDRFIGSIARLVARSVVSTPERFQAAVDAARERGIELPDPVDYKGMREFIERDHYTVEVSQAWLVKQIFDSIEILLPLLAARSWALFVSRDEDGDFIASDRPVALTWSERRDTGFFGPAFGLRHTDLSFPLSRKIAALARFEGPAGVFRAPPAFVAAINARTGLYCERFICSAREEFPWPRRDGALGGVADLVALVQGEAPR